MKIHILGMFTGSVFQLMDLGSDTGKIQTQVFVYLLC